MDYTKEMKQDKEIFRSIFEEHWSYFKKKHTKYDNKQYEVPVQKMLGCGRESGGYSEYICMDCGRDIRRVCFSCKSCFCLSCAKKYVDDFVSQVSKMLHPGVVYRHIVLTIPEQLRKVFYCFRTKSYFLSSFMRCGYECLEDVVATVRRQGVIIGTIVVVQTNGRSGRYNPHLHVIMTDGGINPVSGKWVNLGYFPYEIIHKKWQYHIFQMLKSILDSDEIRELIDELYREYPNGLVANVTPGSVPGVV